jgi:hypothetical protein
MGCKRCVGVCKGLFKESGLFEGGGGGMWKGLFEKGIGSRQLGEVNRGIYETHNAILAAVVSKQKVL